MSWGLLTVNGETEICLKMHLYAHRSRLVGRIEDAGEREVRPLGAAVDMRRARELREWA